MLNFIKKNVQYKILLLIDIGDCLSKLTNLTILNLDIRYRKILFFYNHYYLYVYYFFLLIKYLNY